MTSRRAFLKSLAPLAGGLLAACAPAPPAPPAPTPAPTEAASPEAPPPATRAPLPTPQPPVAGRITDIDDLYIQTYTSPVPVLERDAWQVAVEGLVASPYTLNWSNLAALPAVEQMQTLECIGNPVGGRLIGNVVWRGVSLRAVLERAEPQPAAQWLVMSAADEYYTSVPLELAMDERSLLAYEANGAPLPKAHGFPARILLPGVYGQKQPKWVTSLRLSDRYVAGYWEKEGWSDEAAIKINSRIEYPRQAMILPPNEPTLITGVAFSDLSGVARVEVSTNFGQTWHDANLLPGPSPSVWTVWAWAWEAPPAGSHVLLARATDGQGVVQTPAEGVLGGVFPDGTSGIHRVVMEVG